MPAIAPATIAELARKSGVDVASIRSYEEMGLLPKPRRRRGRSDDTAYHQEHLDRLILIRRALALGLNFEAISELTGASGGLQTCNDVYRTVERHLATLPKQVGELPRAALTLRTLAESCSRKGTRAGCAILVALSQPGE